MSISEIKQILDELNIRLDPAKNTSDEIFVLIRIIEQLSKDNQWCPVRFLHVL
jgi:hypothetical protein